MRITLAEPRRFNELLRQRYELPSRSVVRGVTIDSRTVRPGDLFIAIVGSRVDGHEKVAEAVAAGAVAVMVENDVSIPGGAASIRTNDNVKEFGRLAAEWHGMFRIPVVGITGSNGKTTTKDLLAAILRRKYHVLASERSMNSTTGLPLTLLRQEEAHEVAVIELGANKPGEIAYLTRLARPSLGLITNVSLTHVEYFHDLAGVVQEKTKLFRGLPPEGIAYINADVPELVEQDVPCRRYSYGFHEDAQLVGVHNSSPDGDTLSVGGRFTINLPQPSFYLAQNVLAATAVALNLGMTEEDIRLAVESFRIPRGRGVISNYNGITVIDDTWNANLVSTLAGLEMLDGMATTGRRIVVFGDMLELGTFSTQHHKQAGQAMAEHRIDELLCYGPAAQATCDAAAEAGVKARHFDTKEQLCRALADEVQAGDIVYAKGSRAMAMETVITEVLSN